MAHPNSPAVADPEPFPPHEPLGRLFGRFLRFGCLAWGGPVAQIAMIRRELVDEERWISSARFNRTLAIYQALPGPEAHELCVYFGMQSRGRIGGLLAGLGFMLPGFVLMFALSWFYLGVGIESPLYRSIFAGLQASVLALIVRAVHRIGGHAIRGGWLWSVAASSFVAALLGMQFVVLLALAGATYLLASRGRAVVAAALLVVLLAVSAIPFATGTRSLSFDALGPADPIAAPEPATAAAGPGELLISGLRAGLLSFGGAYTAIPILQQDAVEAGGWLTNRQFLDGIALSGTLPAPLIIFATFIGFVAGGPLGALVITLGVFLPAFAFTLLGHRYFERLVEQPSVHAFLDGIAAGVVGLIATTALVLAPAAISSPVAAVVFAGALVAIYLWTARWSVAVVVLASGLLSLVLFGVFPQ